MRTDSVSTPAANNGGLYRRIWRWHFFAGLVCVPFIFSLAVTGAMYLFHKQIDDVVYAQQMLRIQPADGAALPPSQLIAAALEAYPGNSKALWIPADAGRNAQVDVIRPDGATLQVFVDPSSGAIAGTIDESARVMTIVKHIHSLAILGDGGNMVIEIVAGWIIVLMASGIYLWWPRGRSGGVVSIPPSVKIVVASSNWSSNLPWGDGFYDDEIHQREERARAQPNERAA